MKNIPKHIKDKCKRILIVHFQCNAVKKVFPAYVISKETKPQIFNLEYLLEWVKDTTVNSMKIKNATCSLE